MSVRSTMRGRIASTVAVSAGAALMLMAAGCDKAKETADTATSAAGSAVSTATDKAASAIASATNGASPSGSVPASSGAGAPGVLESPTASAPPAPVVPSTAIASPQGQNVSITDPAIIAEYASRGYDKGYLGKPLGPVATLPSGGKFLTLQGGSIYLNPTAKKAYSVHGAIGGYWGTKGHETSPLGYPNAEETPVDGGLSQSFDNGTLIDKGGVVTQK